MEKEEYFIMKQLEERHGSIYLHGNIVEDLMFILTIEKDDDTTSLYKFGDKSQREPHLKKLEPMKDFVDVVSFSFGEFYESQLTKQEQIQIVEFIIDYKGHPLTRKLGVALRDNDDTELIESIEEILKFTGRDKK